MGNIIIILNTLAFEPVFKFQIKQSSYLGDFCKCFYSFKIFIHTMAMKIIKANIVESILGTKRGGGAGLVESCL